MTITELTVKMIDKASGNLHDICHFLKVHSYAKMIGEMEKLDSESQFILEAAAVVVEGFCCRGVIQKPWLFAFCINLFSYGVGELLQLL